MNSGTGFIETANYGKAGDGTPISLYTLKNTKGASVQITNYGAIIVSINVPDRQGRIEDIVLGFDSLDGYLGTHPYFGAIIGRYGNRIGKARFELEGKT